MLSLSRKKRKNNKTMCLQEEAFFLVPILYGSLTMTDKKGFECASHTDD